MRSDQIDSLAGGAPPSPVVDRDPPSEIERLRGECRRQATQIDTLREAVSMLTRGARALKAENADLRIENGRLVRSVGWGKGGQVWPIAPGQSSSQMSRVFLIANSLARNDAWATADVRADLAALQ